MLSILFNGESDRTLWDIDTFFKYNYEPEWLSDNMVRAMVKDVDDLEIVDSCIISPVLGQIPPESLSGGVKALIWLLKCSDEELNVAILDLFLFGENCQEWLLKIGELRDITLTCNTYDLGFDCLNSSNYKIYCLNDNSVVRTSKEWVSKMIKFAEY